MNTSRSIETAYGIWDELAHFGSAEVTAALEYLLTQLCQHTQSHNSYWLGAVRLDSASANDPLLGWRPRVVHHLHKNPSRIRYSKQRIKHIEKAPVDTSMQAHVRLAGQFRAHRLRELVPPQWLESDYAQEIRQLTGMRDIIYIAVPLSADMESYIQLERTGDAPLYTAQERDFAAYVVRGLRWFHRQVSLAFGLQASQSPFTAAERHVLHLLLTEKSEKSIAHELGITANTTHSYVRQIYRKLNVKGRSGLLALWLGQHSGDEQHA